ncbi:MAG: cache domain-containing protein [Rhodocyclaceae bacterium]|nr:cache domain-containing protein [Rhodocyclaceae bacterium]
MRRRRHRVTAIQVGSGNACAGMTTTGRIIGWRGLLALMPAIGIAGMLLVSWLFLSVFRQTVAADEAKEARVRVDLAQSILGYCHGLETQGKLSRADAQQRAKDLLREVRTREGHYLWVNDMAPVMVMHPIMPELEGRSLADYKDANGKLLFLAFVDTARQTQGGYVAYAWPRPNGTTAQRKLSYVKLFEPWQWVVGSGVYLDDIDAVFWQDAWPLIPVIVGVGLLSILIAVRLRRQILLRVGGDIENATAIARHLAGGDLQAPLALPAGDRPGLLDTLEHWRRQLGGKAGGKAAARRRAEVEHRRLSEALQQSHEAIVLAEADLHIAYVNPAFTRLFGYTLDEVAGQSARLLEVVDDSSVGTETTAAIASEAGIFRGEVRRRGKDGRAIPVLINVAPVVDAYRITTGYVATMTDLTEIKRAQAEAQKYVEDLTVANVELRDLNDKLKQTQAQLLQSEKMASIGVLAAGVAHEINNPIGFIRSNIHTLGRYVGDFLRLLHAYENAERRLPAGSDAFAEARAVRDEAGFAYEKADVAGLLAESAQGIERVTKIVRDLKEFSRVDVAEQWQAEDIHAGLDITLDVVRNELGPQCEVRKEYGALPRVECLLSQLNQVFMNLLLNAGQAIAGQGTITLRTGSDGAAVWVEIADTGCGIAAENLERIFDPFYTTKPVGKGTGLGLSVSYGIVRKHHGSIEVDSAPGRGSTFRIRLPVRQPASATA